MTGGPFRRVLVGWGGSPDAAEALSVAAEIAGRDHGHLVTLAVLRHGARTESAEDADGGEPAIVRLAQAQFELRRQRLRLAGDVRMTAHALVDDRNSPVRAVCEYAAVHGFDLLVLGRHGANGGPRSRLGRVADEVAQVSRVPLLLGTR